MEDLAYHARAGAAAVHADGKSGGGRNGGTTSRRGLAPARSARFVLVPLQPDFLVRAALADRRLRYCRDRIRRAASDTGMGPQARWARACVQRESDRHSVRLGLIRL